MTKAKLVHLSPVVGGVDTHKDLHVAAVVDQNNRVLGSEFFTTTRQGYRQMLAWMASFGTVKRIGVECTGSYGAGLLRYLQSTGVEVLEVTAPDKRNTVSEVKAIPSIQKVLFTQLFHTYEPSYQKLVAE